MNFIGDVIKAVLPSILLVGSNAIAAEDCKHRILLIPQIHASIMGEGLEVTPAWFEQTARSQYEIANYLAKNQGNPVFSEQISSDKSMETVSDDFKRIIPPMVKKLFPKGLPANYTNLSVDQKTFLAKAGGDLVSLVLGQTPLLHRVIDGDQTENSLIDQIKAWRQRNPYASDWSPEISNIIFNKRESFALGEINRYFADNPKQKDAVLVFGEAHVASFHLHASQFPPQCIVTPPEFGTVNESPYGSISNNQTPKGNPSGPANAAQ